MKVKLNNGLFAIVDAKDYKRVIIGPQWYAWATYRNNRSGNQVRTYYAMRNIVSKNGNRTTQLMHRFLLGLKRTKAQADHRDGNGLNNLRRNLKRVTNIQNSQNRQRLNTSSTSGVTGVYRDKKNNKWVAEIITYGVYRFLGRFSSIGDATKARRKAERERERDLRGTI